MHGSRTLSPCCPELFGVYGRLSWVNGGYNIKFKVKFSCTTTTFYFLVGTVTMN